MTPPSQVDTTSTFHACELSHTMTSSSSRHVQNQSVKCSLQTVLISPWRSWISRHTIDRDRCCQCLLSFGIAPWTGGAFRAVSDLWHGGPASTSASVQVVCSSRRRPWVLIQLGYGTSLVVDVSQCVKAVQSHQNTQGSLLGHLLFIMYIGCLFTSTSWSRSKKNKRCVRALCSPGGCSKCSCKQFCDLCANCKVCID